MKNSTLNLLHSFFANILAVFLRMSSFPCNSELSKTWLSLSRYGTQVYPQLVQDCTPSLHHEYSRAYQAIRVFDLRKSLEELSSKRMPLMYLR